MILATKLVAPEESFYTYKMARVSLKSLLPALDLRSLILFRQSLAIVVLFDLLIRLGGFNDFYTDEGFLPRSLMITNTNRFSFHLASGNVAFVGMLFALQFYFAIQLFRGVHTRLSTIATW
ncbi:MAG: hypothetical protein EOP09_13790, partial [Proteobacteria bacterium]